MSKKISEIRESWGEYAFDIEYPSDYTYAMYFNSLRNAQTVRRCLQVDDSVPNVATPVDFVEVVRCRDCKWWTKQTDSKQGRCALSGHYTTGYWYCANGERRIEE